MLYKLGVLYIFVNCYWFLNKVVVLVYYDMLIEENEIFRE